MIQGGDIVRGDSKGSESIYGGIFPDENFTVKHTHPATPDFKKALYRDLLSCLSATSPNILGLLLWRILDLILMDLSLHNYYQDKLLCRLDGEHVVFGRVIQGMDTVYAIEGGAGTYNGKPRKKAVITDAGEIPKEKWGDQEAQGVFYFLSPCHFQIR
ncbi:hypothetical protein ZEAMMB73_Zm00001d043918 [Zea mays]|uniref:peptidylprolyl isomerase n=1 Tax=Zea mays TaxID=4577 RepID=A0A1D6NG89_MAIZE|nr:hypothetical protein ZEAMMB73_Zm00001d043918 [Zea mays]